MRAVFKLVGLLLVAWSLYSPAVRGADASCHSWDQAPGQVTIIPAQVTGARDEKLYLHADPWHQDVANNKGKETLGYLITGDRLDIVTACGDYTYVRYHGHDRVSVGWVEKTRLVETGKSQAPLPPNATALCAAAQRALNVNFGRGRLKVVSTEAVDADTERHLNPKFDDGTPQELARLVVDRRQLAAVTYMSQGTCSGDDVRIWKGDLSAELTPVDINERNPLNDGSNGALFGSGQTLVDVLGQPMIWSYDGGDTSYLSAIGRDGDLTPICQIDRVPVDRPVVEKGAESKICPSVAAGAATRVALTKFRDTNSPDPEAKGDVINTGDASSADYILGEVGVTDLDNSGNPAAVGMVHYEYYDGRGCGYADLRVVPLFLSGDKKVDLGSAENKRLFEAFPTDVKSGFLVRQDGITYVALSPNTNGPPREVWQVSRSAIGKVCDFQLFEYRVRLVGKRVAQ